MTNYIAYLRVSTQRQGQSGLGLEAQRQTVTTHAAGGTILAEYVEVESGKRDDRTQLAAALKHCKVTGSTLLVAKLDRLSRNVEFTARLMNAGVDFIAADMPYANRLTIHIIAAMAEHEREMISQRTKAALEAAKRRGKVLGGHRDGAARIADHQAAGARAIADKADAYAQDVADILLDIGPGTLRHIADQLTARGIKTPRGGQWSPTAVSRVQHRIGAAT